MRYLAILILFISLAANAQQVKNIAVAFQQVNHYPKVIWVENSLDVPTKGGHLQGIQVRDDNKAYISGSSKEVAYILQCQLNEASGKVEKLHEVGTSPYRHAGGIQISGAMLAVGIEDNKLKDRSLVKCFTLSSFSEKLKPVEREGKIKRQTAGATAFYTSGPNNIFAVADWGSQHIDIYTFYNTDSVPQLLGSITPPDSLGSYQAINFVSSENVLYLVGFYTKGMKCYANLLQTTIKLDSSGIAPFKKLEVMLLSKREFLTSQGASFRNGAGLEVSADGKLMFWATGKNAGKRFVLNRFE